MGAFTIRFCILTALLIWLRQAYLRLHGLLVGCGGIASAGLVGATALPGRPALFPEDKLSLPRTLRICNIILCQLAFLLI